MYICNCYICEKRNNISRLTKICNIKIVIFVNFKKRNLLAKSPLPQIEILIYKRITCFKYIYFISVGVGSQIIIMYYIL